MMELWLTFALLITSAMQLPEAQPEALGGPKAATRRIVRRDDRADSLYVERGKRYRDVICGLAGAAGTLAAGRWVIGTLHV